MITSNEKKYHDNSRFTMITRKLRTMCLAYRPYWSDLAVNGMTWSWTTKKQYLKHVVMYNWVFNDSYCKCWIFFILEHSLIRSSRVLLLTQHQFSMCASYRGGGGSIEKVCLQFPYPHRIKYHETLYPWLGVFLEHLASIWYKFWGEIPRAL